MPQNRAERAVNSGQNGFLAKNKNSQKKRRNALKNIRGKNKRPRAFPDCAGNIRHAGVFAAVFANVYAFYFSNDVRRLKTTNRVAD
jgi:hypothetical protein